jgi:hypothetical protein
MPNPKNKHSRGLFVINLGIASSFVVIDLKCLADRNSQVTG